MNIHVRIATAEDMPQVLGLIQELAVFEKEPDAVVVTVEELVTQGFGATPQFTCFVAEVEDRIVGMALVYFRFSTWKGKTVHLEDLVVKESFRGKGIGAALYKKVITYAEEQGVRRLEFIVLNWNKGAIAMYEKSGAKFHKDWWLVELDQEGIQAYLNHK